MNYNLYTFFAEKPDTDTITCQYYGDTIFAYEQNKENVIKLLTHCLVSNKTLRLDEKGYEIIILFGGNLISKSERSELNNIAEAFAQKRIDDRMTEEQRILKMKSRLEKEDKEKVEQALYEALREKFHSSKPPIM